MTKIIYAGPTIPGVAIRNAVYEELPEALQTAIEALPYLNGLCVPIAVMPQAMDEIDKKSGRFYTLYAKAEKERAKIQKAALQRKE
jgi:hypothetical protein